MTTRLRQKKSVSYREAKAFRMPRPLKRRREEERLFPVEIIERDVANGRYKVHYVGYSSKHDEWKFESDLVPISEEEEEIEDTTPYSCHTELAYQVKLALNSSRKGTPVVRLEVAMDLVTFRGGLAHYGTKLPACVRQQPVYGISKYGDLDPLLGKGWYLRVLNKGGDFCYCAKESVQFYLHRRKSLEEVDQDGKVVRCLGGGYILIFKFVRMDGTCAQYPAFCQMQ